MAKVIYIDKVTHEAHLYGTCKNEEEAIRICEMWGWNYDDGYKSYWLDYVI